MDQSVRSEIADPVDPAVPEAARTEALVRYTVLVIDRREIGLPVFALAKDRATKRWKLTADKRRVWTFEGSLEATEAVIDIKRGDYNWYRKGMLYLLDPVDHQGPEWPRVLDLSTVTALIKGGGR